MQYLKPSEWFLFACFLAVTLTSCTGADPQDQATYNRLCRIYEDVRLQAMDREEKRVEIYDRVYKQLPGLSEMYFGAVLKADRDKRYGFLQQVVEVQTGNPDWECQAIKSFYGND